MSDTAKGVFGGIAGIIAIILVPILLIVLGVYVYGNFWQSTADTRGKQDVTEKTIADGDYRIASYNLFFDRCGAIQAKQANIKNLEEQVKTASPDDKQWLLKTIQGVQAGLYDDITQYNADAAKTDTAGHFRASNLPYHIDINDKETKCAS